MTDALAPPEAGILTFPGGIPGFPTTERFVLRDLTEDGTFQELASVDDPALALIVLSPWLAFPGYAPELPEEDQEFLGIEDPSDVIVFCAVNAPEDVDGLTVNLLGPFVVNRHSLIGRQVILTDQSLDVRTPLPTGS